MTTLSDHKTHGAATSKNGMRFQSLFEHMLEGVAIYEAVDDGRDFVFSDMNRAGERIFQVKREDIVGRRVTEVFPGIRDMGLFDALRAVWKTGERTRHPVSLYQDDRMARWAENSIFKLPDGEIVAVFSDVTERMNALKALQESNELLDATGQMARVGGWELDAETLAVTWTDETYRIHEVPVGQQPPLEEAINFFHPDDRGRLSRAIELALKEGKPYDMELRFITAKGNALWTRTACRPEMVDGRTVRLRGTFQDITEQKQAELERENLHAQLIQAQKLESVGRLAGGVAHDFNNMLGVILGRAEMALMGLKPWDPYYLDFQEIRKVAKRSADIVRKMLAFARKQTISPKVLDLNETIEGMLKMLRRLIGENINLTWLPGKRLWPVYMDPSQMDQILANLCVNARDAIHHTGKITIETTSVALDQAYCDQHAGIVPGEYVLLAVSDDGIGMNREVLDNVFDPFFTTKEVGKGTGLGLATIYGIVKQNNGFINVYSEPGVGTTFRIYFPRHTPERDEAPPESQAPPLKRGDETILLVEDDVEILTMTQLILEGLGYTVLAFSAPEEAVRAAKAYTADIHLLMTDVVMPKMDGRSLSERLLPIYPKLKCLFMSGYTADVIAHHGVLDEGVHFIQKPFSMLEISIKVREVLDGEP